MAKTTAKHPASSHADLIMASIPQDRKERINHLLTLMSEREQSNIQVLEQRSTAALMNGSVPQWQIPQMQAQQNHRRQQQNQLQQQQQQQQNRQQQQLEDQLQLHDDQQLQAQLKEEPTDLSLDASPSFFPSPVDVRPLFSDLFCSFLTFSASDLLWRARPVAFARIVAFPPTFPLRRRRLARPHRAGAPHSAADAEPRVCAAAAAAAPRDAARARRSERSFMGPRDDAQQYCSRGQGEACVLRPDGGGRSCRAAAAVRAARERRAVPVRCSFI